ncbi:hypothetical protein LSH36_206g04085 [Paralvinella palmiformis]|uniref:Apple domain-containing protein n=1 Tax=Paralvinella palmiformis TaxID=53620 RepID=A0AAD9JQH7_9ANNE|nr:hypothetical protein LSH36_206g04085 [Paralvinella palmiformis]
MSCCFVWLMCYLLISAVVSEIDGQACCTLFQWEKIVGSHLTNYSVVIHDYDTRYCQRKCRQDPFCVTFDSYEDNSIVSCYLNKHYHQLLRNYSSTHWEYRRTCTTTSGYSVMSVVIVIFICTTIFVTIHYRKKLSHLMTRNVSSQNFDDLNRNVQGVFFSANNSANDELRGRDEFINLDRYIRPTANYEEIRYSVETSTANIDSTDVKQTASNDDNLNRVKYREDRNDKSQTMTNDTTQIKYRGSTDSTQCKH